MDIKEIVDKALKGEDVSELTKDFDADKSTEFGKAMKKAADEELAKVAALRKEGDRIAKPPEQKPDDVQAKFRQEQIDKAKERLYSDPQYPLTEDEKKSLEDTFSRIDSGKIDADNILKDFKRAYAAVKSDDLISARDKVTTFEKNAADFTAGGANASGGLSPEDETKYSKEAKELYASWQKAGMTGANRTLDAAQRVSSQGTIRRL